MPTSDAHEAPKTVPFRLPDPPEYDSMDDTSYDFVYMKGEPMNLAVHFGRPETTLVGADRPVVKSGAVRSSLRPNLLIAFDVDPRLYREQGGFCIADQGKPPDFLLEVAFPSTAYLISYNEVGYAAMGIPEYWRFDRTGEAQGAKLIGGRLVGQRYEPIPLVEIGQDVLEGYSEAINLTLRWDHGELIWVDPATGQPIPGLEEERAKRLAAEDRVQALEAELRRLRDRDE